MTKFHRIVALAFGAAVLGVPALATAGEFAPVSMPAFQAAIAAHRPVVFYVRTRDGMLCTAQHKVLEQLMAEPAFKDYLVLEVDFTGNPQTVKMLGAVMPATIIFDRDGVDIGRVQGVTDEPSIRALLAKTTKG